MDVSAAAVQQAYAAWVQAVGSLIAIGVAIYVPYRQRRDDLRLRELHYWTERADVERRLLVVANDIHKMVQRLIDETKPSAGSTRLCSYYPTLHEEFLSRLDALEARNIGENGHDRVATMRRVLTRLKSLFPIGASLSIKPDSNFSRELAEGPIAQDAEACVSETSERLDNARVSVSRFGGGG